MCAPAIVLHAMDIDKNKQNVISNENKIRSALEKVKKLELAIFKLLPSNFNDPGLSAAIAYGCLLDEIPESELENDSQWTKFLKEAQRFVNNAIGLLESHVYNVKSSPLKKMANDVSVFLGDSPRIYLNKDEMNLVLDIAKEEPCTGTLMIEKDNFVHVKVSDSFIQKIKEILPKIGFEGCEPPSEKGAHVTVIAPRAEPKAEFGKIQQEIATWKSNNIEFEIKGAYEVTPDEDSRLFKILALELECAQLEELRQSGGLSAKFRNHPFHITLATVLRKPATINVTSLNDFLQSGGTYKTNFLKLIR
jgi:hypothetical protein